MRLIDADLLKEDLSRFYDGLISARELIDSQPTVELLKEQNGLAKALEQMTATNDYLNKEVERLEAELLKQRKTKEEVLLAIIGKQGYTELEEFKQLEVLHDDYFDGMLDSIRAVERLFEKGGEQE